MCLHANIYISNVTRESSFVGIFKFTLGKRIIKIVHRAASRDIVHLFACWIEKRSVSPTTHRARLILPAFGNNR